MQSNALSLFTTTADLNMLRGSSWAKAHQCVFHHTVLSISLRTFMMVWCLTHRCCPCLSSWLRPGQTHSRSSAHSTRRWKRPSPPPVARCSSTSSSQCRPPRPHLPRGPYASADWSCVCAWVGVCCVWMYVRKRVKERGSAMWRKIGRDTKKSLWSHVNKLGWCLEIKWHTDADSTLCRWNRPEEVVVSPQDAVTVMNLDWIGDCRTIHTCSTGGERRFTQHETTFEMRKDETGVAAKLKKQVCQRISMNV